MTNSRGARSPPEQPLRDHGDAQAVEVADQWHRQHTCQISSSGAESAAICWFCREMVVSCSFISASSWFFCSASCCFQNARFALAATAAALLLGAGGR